MDIPDCQARRVLPDVTAGHRVTEGAFLHNIEISKSSLRYPKHPEFGRGVKGGRLNWTTEGAPVLSVNQRRCVTCACCSLLLDQHPSKHSAVLQFNLPAICSLINVQLVAIYSPVSEPEYQNPCHFELLIDDGVTWDRLEASLKRILQSPSQDAVGWPRNLNSPAEKAIAEKRMREHDAAYSVELNPCDLK